MDKYRFDYVFTYWIFICYILYIYKRIPYNPLPVIYFGIAFLCVQLVFFLYTKVKISRIALFLFVNAFLKFIPLYTLIHTVYTWEDVKFYVGMFFVYVMWLVVNDVNIHDFFMTYLSPNLANTSGVRNKAYTPFNNMMKELFPNTF